MQKFTLTYQMPRAKAKSKEANSTEQTVGWEEETPKKERNTEGFKSKADAVLGTYKESAGGYNERHGDRHDDRRGGYNDRRDDRRDFNRGDDRRRDFEDRRGGYNDRRDERKRGYNDRRDDRGRDGHYERRDDRRGDRRDFGDRVNDDRRRDDRRRENEPSAGLVVFGIGFEYNNDTLRDVFSRHIRDDFNLNVVCDRETRRPKGFCFMNFQSVDAAKNAKEALERAGPLPNCDNIRIDFSKERQRRY